MSWFRKPHPTSQPASDIASSILYDEATFYNQFTHDLLQAREEVIIESPYITVQRLKKLKPVFEKLVEKGVNVFIVTKHPQEHDEVMAEHAEAGIRFFEALGPQVLLCDGGHHRKLAMIDRSILWEGSLNILSQSHSREFMRRIESKKLTEEMFQFLKFDTLEFFKKKI